MRSPQGRTLEKRAVRMFNQMNNRVRNHCRYVGRVRVRVSKEDFVQFALASSSFKELFRVWEESGFNPKLVPVPDRINPVGDYILGNIQFLSATANRSKSNSEFPRAASPRRKRNIKMHFRRELLAVGLA